MKRNQEQLMRSLSAATFAHWQYVDQPSKQRAEVLLSTIQAVQRSYLAVEFEDGILPVRSNIKMPGIANG